MKPEKKSLSQDSKKSVNDHVQNQMSNINNLNPCEKAQENDLIMEKKTEKIFSDELYKAMADLEVTSYKEALEVFKTSHLDETPIHREIFFWSFVALYFLNASVLTKNEDCRKEQEHNFWSTLWRVPQIYRTKVLMPVRDYANNVNFEISKTFQDEYMKGSFMACCSHVIESDNEEKVRIVFYEYYPSFSNLLTDINDVKTACEIWDIDLDSICIEESPEFPGYEVSVKKGTKLWDFYSKSPVMDLRQMDDMEDYLNGRNVLIAPTALMEKIFSLV